MSNPLADAKLHKKVDVSAERIARVYAEALFDAAPKGEADSLNEELRELVELAYRKVPSLAQFFASGTINKKVKAEFIDKNFRGKGSETLVNFLQVINNHGRLDLLFAIAAGYQQLVDEKNKRASVVVKSAVPLEDNQRTSLKKQLKTMFDIEPMLDEQVDPELLGGFLVRYRDWQFDGTVQARLNQLKNQLLERSSHEIQGRRDRFCTV